MDPKIDLPDLVEDLEVNIDELTETLSPLLETSLSTSASSLPLLDKAKLYVLAAYSIESLLYSTLSASGVNAKEHAVFRELGRLKGYFGKIKEIEERDTSQQPKQKLDVGAAARFIRHGLAGNEKYDLERAERMAKERARAKLKAAKINKKFNDAGEEVSTPKKRPAEEQTPEPPRGDEEEFSDTELIEGFEDPQSHTTKKQKLSSPHQASGPSLETPDPTKKPDKRSKKTKNKASDTSEPEPEAEAEHDVSTDQNKKKRKKSSKKDKKTADAAGVQAQGNGVTPEQSKKGKGKPKKK